MDLVVGERLDIIPTLRSIEAWRARDGDRAVTLVRSRPDIVEAHLFGDDYCSNIEEVEIDMQEIAARPPAPHELRLLEIRYVTHARVPFGIFEPYVGWPLNQVIRRVRCKP